MTEDARSTQDSGLDKLWARFGLEMMELKLFWATATTGAGGIYVQRICSQSPHSIITQVR
jgi:hypothetical protein